jgi:hypothetical protein
MAHTEQRKQLQDKKVSDYCETKKRYLRTCIDGAGVGSVDGLDVG